MPLSPERLADLDSYYGQQNADPFMALAQSQGLTQSATLTPDRIAELDAYYGGQGRASQSPSSFLSEMGANFKQGFKNIGDVATGNWQDIGEYKPTPRTESLASKIFPQGSLQGNLSENIGDTLLNMRDNTNLSDYSGALLEKFNETPPGKAAGAIAGLVPEFNAVMTATNRYVNPAIEDITGIAPENLQLAELIAGTKGGKLSSPTNLPSTIAAKAITYPVRHPLETTGAAINMATKPALTAIRPIARGILEADNPITGEPGLKTAMESPVAQEGTRLGEKMGVNFSAGELTGNPTARGLEDALANSARWGGKFAEANQRKVDAITSRFTKTLDAIYHESSSRTDVGERLSSAYNNTINSLIKARRTEAKADAQAADIATRGQPLIDPANFRGVLEKFIEEGNSPTATPAQRAAAEQASSMLGALKASAPKESPILDRYGNPIQTATEVQPWKKLTARDVQNGLAMYGDGAKSGGGIWKDISTASDRRFAIGAKEALQSDLNTAADSGIPEATALKAFRDNYRKNSNKISDVQKTAIGKIVGGAEHNSQGQLMVSPEAMADKFSAMQPTEIRNTLAFLDKNHPDVAKMARRYTLERALREAQEGRGLRGEGTTKEFSKAEFVKRLPDREKLNALLKDAAAANDITDVAAAMNRMIDYGAQKKGSQTAQRTDFLHTIAGWGKGAFYRSIVSDSLAEDLLNPVKRRAMANEIRQNNAKKTEIGAHHGPL